jgi:putative transposase
VPGARTYLNNAFRNFFAKRAGFPKWRKKGRRDSFPLSNDQFAVDDKSVRIPLLGWVRMAEGLRFEGRIIGATVSRSADQWYIAIQVELQDAPSVRASENQAVGVDLGISALATLSDGTKITGPKASMAYEKKLRRLNQELSRRHGANKGEAKSRNFIKTKRKLAKLHAKMANTRADGTHKLTIMLARGYDLIGLHS